MTASAIEVWGLENDEATLDSTLTLDDQGQVAFAARDPRIIPFLQKIECPGPGRRYLWTDGLPWLRLLPSVLRGTTCWARSTEDGPPAPDCPPPRLPGFDP
jgi:hypothetical protein